MIGFLSPSGPEISMELLSSIEEAFRANRIQPLAKTSLRIWRTGCSNMEENIRACFQNSKVWASLKFKRRNGASLPGCRQRERHNNISTQHQHLPAPPRP